MRRLSSRAISPARHGGGDTLAQCHRGSVAGAAGATLLSSGTAAETRSRSATSGTQFTWRSMPSQYGARSLNFCNLPVAVRASSVRNSITVGDL